MYDHFEKLSGDKKEKILNAAIEEFALNGYDKASTNEIVKKAGISKGILFHYFGSKKELCLYLFDYVINYYVEKFERIKAELPGDLFQRIMYRGFIKMRFAHEDPIKYEFLYKTFINPPEDIKQDLQVRYEKLYADEMPKYFHDLDYSRFRKGVDPKKAIEAVMLFIDGISNKYIKEFSQLGAEEVLGNMEKLVEEYNEFLEIIKWGIYEREEKI